MKGVPRRHLITVEKNLTASVSVLPAKRVQNETSTIHQVPDKTILGLFAVPVVLIMVSAHRNARLWLFIFASTR